MELEIKMKHVYFIMGALIFITFFFYNQDKVPVPTYATTLTLLLLIMIGAESAWKAWQKAGSLVITTLGIGKGSSDGFNPSGDKINATARGKPSFTCIATGGFVWAGFSCSGSKNFIVCPPEHVQEVGGNIFIRTKLRKIRYNDLPSYVQQSLIQLPGFKLSKVIKKHNLWFGMTSQYYGTDSAENMKIEEKLIADMSVQNEYKHMLDDLTERKKVFNNDKPPLIRLIPEEEE